MKLIKKMTLGEITSIISDISMIVIHHLLFCERPFTPFFYFTQTFNHMFQNCYQYYFNFCFNQKLSNDSVTHPSKLSY